MDSTGAFYVVPRGAEGDVLVPGARGVPLTWTPLGAALAWTATVVSVSPYTPALERVSIVNPTAHGDNMVIDLPPITTIMFGRRLTIKVLNLSIYSVTINGDAVAADYIDNSGSLTITTDGAAVTLIATGLNSGGVGGGKQWLRI